MERFLNNKIIYRNMEDYGVFFENYFRLYPTISSFIGRDTYNRELPKIDIEGYEEKIKFVNIWNEIFEGVDDSEFDTEKKVDIFTMRDFIKNMKIFLTDYPVYRMYPTAHIAVMDSLYSVINDKESFIARASKLTDVLKNYIKNNPVDMPVDIFVHNSARDVGNTILSILEMERIYNLNMRSLVRALQDYSSYLQDITPDKWRPPGEEIINNIQRLRGFETLDYDILNDKIKEENDIIEEIGRKIEPRKSLDWIISKMIDKQRMNSKSDFIEIGKRKIEEINRFIERKYIKDGYDKIKDLSKAPSFLRGVITSIVYYEYRGPYSGEYGKIMVLPPSSPLDLRKHTDLEMKILIAYLLMDHIKISYFNRNKSEVRKLLYHLGLWPEYAEGIFKTDFSGGWDLYALKYLADMGLFSKKFERLMYHYRMRNSYARALGEKNLYKRGLSYAAKKLSELVGEGEDESRESLIMSAHLPLVNSLRVFGSFRIENFVNKSELPETDVHKKLLNNGPVCLNYQNLLMRKRKK